MRILESKKFRGFLHRTAGAFSLCALLGLLLVIPSVSSDTDSAKPAESVNIPLYSDWRGESVDDSSDLLLEELLADDGGVALPAEAFNVGSFSLHRPQSELFINGLIGELYGLSAGAALGSDDIEHYLQARARARLTGESVQDFKTWLTGRGEGITDRVFLTSADYLTNYLTAAATDGAHGLRFVRTVEWDYQSSLGNRRWQTGLSALGALRESADDAIAWQLRGYAAEDSGAGANAGLIYRRASGAADGALLGVNVFLDYEKHGDYDEDFLRWSLGGEYRNAYLDVYLNRYFPITDGVKQGNGNYVYTQGGQEAYLNVKAPDFGFGRVSGGLTYYLWEGEYGDADDKGFRYHIGFAPQRGNLRLELELDSPDGGSTDWGGRVSYRHIIGGADKGNASASSDAAFDARAHFFDVVRREYAQRIRESGDGRAAVVVARLTDTSESDAELAFLDTSVDPADPTTVTVVTLSVANNVGGSHAIDPSRTVGITVSTNSALELTASKWLVTVFAESAVRLREAGSELSVSSGTISFQRSDVGLNSFNVAGTRIALLGTQGETGIDGNATPSSFMRLMEGTIALTVTTANEIDLDIVELKAVAMVTEEIPDVNGVVNRVERMIGCDTAAQREDHRALQSDFAGCVDDVRISGLGDGEQVMLRTQGEDLILRGNADSEIVVLDGDGNNPSSTTWSSYPFHPHGARLTLLAADATNDGINISHGEDANESVLVVAEETTLAFSYVDEAAAATTPAAVDIYVAVIGEGTASGDVSGVGTETVGCANESAATEGLANVVAICGDVTFDSGEDGIFLVETRIGSERDYEVEVSGGGGSYVFALMDADGAPVETGDILELEAVTATMAAIQFSPEERIFYENYHLQASPLPAFADFADAAMLQVVANAHLADLKVERDGEVVATVRTELDSNQVLHPIASNGGSDVTYDYVGGKCDLAGCDALRTDYFNVGAGDGRISITSTTAIPAALIAGGREAALGNFPLTVTLSVEVVDPHPTDEGLNATVIAEFGVVVRHPSGDVTDTPEYISTVTVSDAAGNDYAVYRLGADAHILTFSETGNLPSVGISVSGIADGGAYSRTIVGNVGDLFTLEVENSPTLRFGTVARTGDLGLRSVTVRTSDDHSLTDAHDTTVRISLAKNLESAAPAIVGSPGTGGANDTGFAVDIDIVGYSQTLTVITIVNGFGDYKYTLESVTPANAADLFAVAASVQVNVDSTLTVGVVSFADDGKFRETGPITAAVLVTDDIGGERRFSLTLNVSSPLVVNTNVPHQFIDEDFYAAGVSFHEFPSSDSGRDGDLVSGGTAPYTYALVEASTNDGDDFTVIAVAGGLRTGQAATAGGLATVQITVTDSSANATSYLITVQAIDGDIVFSPIAAGNTGNPLVFDVAYNADEVNDGIIGTVAAAWEQSPGYGALSYRLVADSAASGLLRTLSIDSAGILSLSGVPIATDNAFFFVHADAAVDGYDDGDVNVLSTLPLEVMLDFHRRVNFDNPQTRIERRVERGGGTDTVLASFSASGGTGDYNFSIVGTPAANLVAIDADSGALRQTAGVNASQTLPLTIRVTDAKPALGGSRDVEIAIEWAVVSSFEPDSSLDHILVIGGAKASAAPDNEVWVSEDGEDWAQLSPTGGKIFQARQGHAAVTHRGTVYVSGGGSGTISGSEITPTFDDVWASADGSNWTLVSDGEIPLLAQHYMLARDNDLFIVGGNERKGNFNAFNYDVWRSGDGGRTWATLDIDNRFGDPDDSPLQFVDSRGPFNVGDNFLDAANAVALFHKGSLVVINGDTTGGAEKGRVVVLNEGATPPRWEDLADGVNIPMEADTGRQTSIAKKAGFVFGGEMHLLRGDEIFSSADGAAWVETDNSATYGLSGGTRIGGHAVVSVSADSAIITGGQYGNAANSNRSNIVWDSDNGKSDWDVLKSSPQFGARSYHAMVLVRRGGLALSGPESSLTAPIENRFPHSSGELFRLEAPGGFGVKSIEIVSANPAPLMSRYLAVDDNGLVTQREAVSNHVLLGTVTFRVSDSSSPTPNTAEFTAIVRLFPLVSAGRERVLVIGGAVPGQSYSNEVYASENGKDWGELRRASGKSDHIFAARLGHAAAALGEVVYVSGGFKPVRLLPVLPGDPNYKEIPDNPTTPNLPSRTFPPGDGPNNVDGVVLNDVWSSADGAHWTLLTQTDEEYAAAVAAAVARNAALPEDQREALPDDKRFPARRHHKMIAHEGTLFVIGGSNSDPNISRDGDGALNDVWVSTDGANWTLTGAGSLNHERDAFMVFSYDNDDEGSDSLYAVAGNRDRNQVLIYGDRANNHLNTPEALADDTWNERGTIDDSELAPGDLAPHGVGTSLRKDEKKFYAGADGVVFNAGGGENMWLFGRNSVWRLSITNNGVSETKEVEDAYNCIADSELVGHKTAVLGNRVLVIGGIDSREREFRGVYHSDVWASAVGSVQEWELIQRRPGFGPRYDPAVVVYAPPASVGAVRTPPPSALPLRLARACGDSNTVVTDSLDNGDVLFRVQASGGSSGNYDYSISAVFYRPTNIPSSSSASDFPSPIDAGRLELVADSDDPSIRIGRVRGTPNPIQLEGKMTVVVLVSDGAAKAAATVAIGVSPPPQLELEGPIVPASPIAISDIKRVEVPRNPNLPACLADPQSDACPKRVVFVEAEQDNTVTNIDRSAGLLADGRETGPTKVGAELFRVRSSGGSGEYAQYDYEIVGVSHAVPAGSSYPVLDKTYFNIESIGIGEPRVKTFPVIGTDRTIVDGHEGFKGAFGKITQAKLMDPDPLADTEENKDIRVTVATVTVTVRVTDTTTGETSELAVEVEMFPTQPLELLAYHAPRSDTRLPPHGLIPRRPNDCLGLTRTSASCPAYQPAIHISRLPRQLYYIYESGARRDITVKALQVGDELFRVGAGGIEKSAEEGGYDFSVVGAIFSKDGATPESNIGLVELVEVADEEEFIGEDDSNIRIVRLSGVLPALANANEQLEVFVRVTNGADMVDFTMRVHLQL